MRRGWAQPPVDLGDLAGGDGVLEPAERGLAAQGLGVLGGDGLENRVVPQARVVVGVLVAGDATLNVKDYVRFGNRSVLEVADEVTGTMTMSTGYSKFQIAAAADPCEPGA